MWELPNPFLNEQGEPVPKEDWEKQRRYLRKILTEDFYGELPPSPGNVQAEKEFEKELWGGTALFEVYDLSFGPEESVHEKTAVIRPKEGTAKPIVFCGGYVDEEIAKMDSFLPNRAEIYQFIPPAEARNTLLLAHGFRNGHETKRSSPRTPPCTTTTCVGGSRP